MIRSKFKNMFTFLLFLVAVAIPFLLAYPAGYLGGYFMNLYRGNHYDMYVYLAFFAMSLAFIVPLILAYLLRNRSILIFVGLSAGAIILVFLMLMSYVAASILGGGWILPT